MTNVRERNEFGEGATVKTTDWEAISDLVAYIDRQGWQDRELAAKLAAVRAALRGKGN